MFNKANVVITITIAILTISIWALMNRPETEPPWPRKIQGFCYSPFQEGQSPLEGIFPTVEQIESDLAMLAKKTHAVRTYSMEEPIVEVPRIAKKYGINVALGAWIGADHENNQKEIDLLIKYAARNTNVVRAIVGNEVILRGDIPLSEFLPYLIKVRKALNIPVSTTEPWHVWIKNPELAENVDFIGVHLLPYWEGVALDAAVDYCIEKLRELKEAFPDKPIVIAEVGWPSEGRTRQWADASESSEAIFLRRFLDYAEKQDHIYYVMEAFDQPWKAESEGAVGAYWGVYDVYRQPKFEFTRPIIKIPEWRTLAGISVVIAIITLAMLITNSQTLNIRGRSFLAVIAFALAAVSVWATYDYIHQYLSIRTVIVGVLIVLGMIGVILVLLTEAHEWAETIWVKERRRHKGRLTGLGKSRLTAGQRYHFWAGWMPWIADSLNLVFNMGAVVWSLLMIFAPQKFDPPLVVFSIFPLALFCFKVAKLIYIYRGAHIVASIGQTLSAAIAGLALSNTIARAVWSGLTTSDKPFYRTPKMADNHPFLKAIASSREETLFMILLWLLAVCVSWTKTTASPDLTIWIIVLLMQSLPYFAAFVVSLVSAFPGSGAKSAATSSPSL